MRHSPPCHFRRGNELWVAASGATPYHPTQNVSGDLPRTIKGGFPSNPSDGWDERDLEMYATVLSGDLNDDDPPYDPDTYDDTLVSELTITPAELGALLGFESVESFAEWLGSLSAESREAVLAALSAAGGGM